jgi:hypothetical protein
MALRRLIIAFQVLQGVDDRALLARLGWTVSIATTLA